MARTKSSQKRELENNAIKKLEQRPKELAIAIKTDGTFQDDLSSDGSGREDNVESDDNDEDEEEFEEEQASEESDGGQEDAGGLESIASASGTRTWPCPACTFANHYRATSCAMCETAKPSTSRGFASELPVRQNKSKSSSSRSSSSISSGKIKGKKKVVKAQGKVKVVETEGAKKGASSRSVASSVASSSASTALNAVSSDPAAPIERGTATSFPLSIRMQAYLASKTRTAVKDYLCCQVDNRGDVYCQTASERTKLLPREDFLRMGQKAVIWQATTPCESHQCGGKE